MSKEDVKLIWEAFEENIAPGIEFKFDGTRPISSRHLSDGEIGYYAIAPGDIHYWVEAEITWEGAHYKGSGPEGYWGAEPDEEPSIDWVNVVVIRDEDDMEVTDKTLFNAIQEWSVDQLSGQGWSDMEAMGWDPPEPDDGY
jgi:hypothetical protein